MSLMLGSAGLLAGEVVGLILQRRTYRERVSRPAPWYWVMAAALLCAATMGLMAWRLDDPVTLALGCVFAVGGVAAVWTDVDAHLLLDVVTLPLAGTLLILITVAAVSGGDWDRWWSAVLSSVGVAAVLLVWALFGSLGLGDVKLGLSVGLVLGYAGGWQLTFGGVVLSLLLAAVFAVVLLIAGRSRKSYLPLGPALVVGVVACLLW